MQGTLNDRTREELVEELGKLYAERALRWPQPTGGGGRLASQEQIAELGAERIMRVEAERIGRIKDDFLANLSHELRTPINAILGWSQLLKPATATPEELAEGLEVIQRNARVQVRLIDDLLDMSRIVSGKLRLDVQRVELPAIIEAALESVRPAADAKGIQIQMVLDPVATTVTGDPSRLQQIVWNLLSNAVKFTHRRGQVQVRLERVNSHVELSVSDNGRGISAEFLPHVFERLSQADSSTQKSQTGLGLGLSIVSSLVEMHGGSVRVKSGGEGKGATFLITLPVSAIPASADDQSRDHPLAERDLTQSFHPQLNGVHVLLVDDDPDAVEMVKRILEGCRARVTTATSAAQGLDLFEDERPDVLLTDIGLPQMDGYQFVRRIRSLPPDCGRDVPAAALTAFARSEDRRQAMLAGFDMHLAKPVEPAELVAVVGRLARRT